MENARHIPDLKRREILTAAAATLAAASATVMASPAGAQDVPAPTVTRKRFADKVVIVTGGTSGIGHAAVLAFAKEGASVGFCGRREVLGREIEAAVRRSGGEATFIRADVQNADDVRSFVDGIAGKYRRLDVAFNNAGINIAKPLHETSFEEWNALSDTNVRGVFLAMKYQIPHMLAAGGGSIVITSSVQSIATRAGSAAYTATKRALVGIAQAAALDYGPKGIRVNAVSPGTVDTPMVRNMAGAGLDDQAWADLAKKWASVNIPNLKRMATAEEIAEVVLAISSNDYPFMTGSSIVVDGGMTAQL